MFYTHPALERFRVNASPGSVTNAWEIISRTSLSEWFYITHFKINDSTNRPEPRMVHIDDGYEFQRFINGTWSNTSIGEIYLVNPTWTSDRARILAWRCELLLEMRRFPVGDGGCARYAYLTEFGPRFSEPSDGEWDRGGGELVYQHPEIESEKRLIPGRKAEFDVHHAKQAINWACELFRGDLKAAAQWLHSPLSELGDRAPCDMATAEDERLLEGVVSRLEQSMINQGGVHV